MDASRLVPPAVPEFYKRYRQQLPIFGVLIVFATFMAHDYFREDAKDLAASLNRAKEAYQIRKELQSHDRTLGELVHEVQQIYEQQQIPSGAIRKTPDQWKFIYYFRITLDKDESAQDSNERLLENIKELLGHLRGANSALRDESEKVRAALKKRRVIIDQLHNALHFDTIPDEERIGNLNHELREQGRIEMHLNSMPLKTDVSYAVTYLANAVFIDADTRSKLAEGVSWFWKTASIWLYSAGFLLALGGKLFSVDGVQPRV